MSTGTCPMRIITRDGWTTCARPLQDGTICRSCSSDHAARLRAVPGLLGDLLSLIRRETSHASGPGAAAAPGSRPPIVVELLDMRTDLTASMRSWAGEAHAGPPWALPPVVPALVALWLADQAERIRVLPWAEEYVADTSAHLDRVDRAVNPPAAVLRVLCPDCGERVPMPTADPCDGKTRPDGTPVHCPGCVVITCRGWIEQPDGTRTRCEVWGVRSWWAEHAGTTTTPTAIPHLPGVLLAHGYDVTVDQVRHWADRGQLAHAERGRDSSGRRVYDPTLVALVAGKKTAKRRAIRA